VLLETVGCAGTPMVEEGERVGADTVILRASGPAASLLKVERTMLNLLCHMSGVATATAELVEMAKKNGSKVRIACTRKTTPGLRYFEKRAVAVGGGDTHRLRLDDAVLIKDNHLALGGSVAKCVQRARDRVSFTKKIEVEVTKPVQAIEAANAGADIILLDNMKPDQVKQIIALLQEKEMRDRVLIEASGGIQKENLGDYAKTGVDIISVGAITHSARSIDMSMEVKPVTSKRR
jgi:nicotinate-nucleotide pyrophosphorylase (carboxylating)